MWVLVCQFATAVSAQVGNTPITAAPSSVGNTIAVQPLAGALFFTGDQRERMERARTRGTSSADVSAEATPSVLSGFVKRSDGQSAVWVDGRIRYNVQNDGVRQLQPQDVGGTNERLTVFLKSTASPTIQSPAAESRLKRQRRPVQRVGHR